MARITVEDCLENIPNRFALVLVAAQRTKDLLKNSPSMLDDDRDNKQVVTSLREVAAGFVVADQTNYDENLLMSTDARPLRNNIPSMIDEDLPPEF